MNEKIEHRDTSRIAEFSPPFVWGLIMTTCATLLLVFSPYLFYGSYRSIKNPLAPPQIVAAGIMVEYGINEFQGTTLEDVTLQRKPEFLLSLMLEFVILPLCVLFSWRYLFLKKSQQPGSEGKPGRHVVARSLAGVSGALLIYLLLGNIASAFISPRVYRVMILDNAIDQNRSAVISQLSRIGFKANEFYCLPKNLGGGGRSYLSAMNPTGKTPVTLQELGMPAATEEGTFSVVQTLNDSTLVCKGVGKVVLGDGSYPEYSMRITPENITPTKMN